MVLTALCPLLPGCGSSAPGSDSADCIQKYSVPAGSQFGARTAYAFCTEIHDRTPTPERRAFLACAIPAVKAAGSEFGVRVAIRDCQRQ